MSLTDIDIYIYMQILYNIYIKLEGSTPIYLSYCFGENETE